MPRSFLRKVLAAIVLTLAAGCGAEGGDATAEDETATVRVATFNAYLNRAEEGGLIADLSTPDDEQARAVAEIVQRVAPDIVLLQEFDYDAAGRALDLFRENYLEVSQNGAVPAVYPYVYIPETNTGVHSGRDFDRNGEIVSTPGAEGYGGDAFGYGDFPGHYAMALLSKYPIETDRIRTFRKFLWADMPGARLPVDPETGEAWYDEDALGVFRLSSKNHIDAPVRMGGARLHIIAAHPTPPVFDGPENRNGLRNYDEIRLLADYIEPARAAYIRDDAGRAGGLEEGAAFIILGDMNADPFDGDSVPGAVQQLLDHPMIDAGVVPQSTGGAAQAALQGGVNDGHRTDPAQDTSDFNDAPGRGPGNLRLDYVLPSRAGLRATGAGVYWPAPGEDGYELVGDGWPVVSSDHRLVWIDVEVSP